MPIGMKIQPLDPEWNPPSSTTKPASVGATAAKSRLKRLFERQLPSVLRISAGPPPPQVDVEPSSVALAKMVQNFLEDGTDSAAKHQYAPRVGSRCNCFNGNRDDASDDDLSDTPSSASAPEILKNMVVCSTAEEKGLLADVTRIVEKQRIKGKDEASRNLVVESLVALGYDASTCKSTWEKTASFPAGEYEYIDVVVGEKRLLVELDLRAEFEIARPAKAYRAVVQALPAVFIGGEEKLQQVVALAADAARQSMRRKGLHVPPWRRYDYMKSKWLSPTCNRCGYRVGGGGDGDGGGNGNEGPEKLDQRLDEKKSGEPQVAWELPAVEPKPRVPRGKVVAGLASIF